jgi:hypothetical protein
MMMTQVKNEKIKILILQFKNNYYFYIKIFIYNFYDFLILLFPIYYVINLIIFKQSSKIFPI